MPFFDSHAHYYDRRFTEEYPGGTDAILRYVHAADVAYILNAGTCPETTQLALALAEQYPFLYASAGIHPGDSLEIPDSDLPSALDTTRRQLTHPKCVALGEIGLDYHWDPDGAARQKQIFDTQLSMAEECGMPVIIHDRDAHGDCFDIVRAHPRVTGVFHSYSGSAEMARQLIDLGWYISFSGPVTYKNAHKVREAAAALPLERLLIETDAPYLPPVPHRGEMNHSAYLPFTAAALAEVHGITPEEIAEQTLQNALRFFRLSK